MKRLNEAALKDRLHAAAKELGMSFNGCLRCLVLERFLVRLSASKWREKFVFKGGLLLSRYVNIGRETVDLDFLATKISATRTDLSVSLKEVAAQAVDDGFDFTFEELGDLIHDQMKYPGFSASFLVQFGKIRERFSIDIGVGDDVEAVSGSIPLMSGKGAPLFEDSVSLIAYPIEFIFSEKLQTAIARGPRNSRMKDYHDIYTVLESKILAEGARAFEAVRRTFEHRGTAFPPQPLRFKESDLEVLQRLWSAFQSGLKRQGIEVKTPRQFDEVLRPINDWIQKMSASK